MTDRPGGQPVPVDFKALSDDTRHSHGLPDHYVDERFTCVDCGKECLFTAAQQKQLYEVKKRCFYQRPVRCSSCSASFRETRRTEFPLDQALARLPKRITDDSFKLDCALGIIEFHRLSQRGNLSLALHLLRAQREDSRRVKRAMDYCTCRLAPVADEPTARSEERP